MKHFFARAALIVFCTGLLFSQELTPSDKPPQSDTAESAAHTENAVTQLWTLDFMLLARELSAGGIGFGVQYERQIFPHYAFKGYFGHATMNTRWCDYYCTTVTLGLFAEWYPLSKELRKLYVAMGSYFDYLGYISKTEDTEDISGNVISFESLLGYKFSLPKHFLLDVFIGYKLPFIVEAEAHGRAESYLKHGIQYGLGLKHTL